ncbi:MAG: phosphoribosylglycinamide formyltransferase [Kiloniellales bacterium]|nr:phosphoribosylglycinamide formyltransferase [Kiloniellales bacterium]
MTKRRVAVLISGRGSNLAALIEAARAADFPAEIVQVISNRPAAAGLDLARRAGIEALTIDHTRFDGRAAFEAEVGAALERAGAELVCLAGFMRLLTGGFIARWRDRLINIHPSLLPLFPGLDTHARALAAGVKLAGCTVHFVREETDNGPILGQAAVPVLPDDTEESLAARVLEAEHRLYPACLRLVAEGRVSVTGETARVDAAGPAEARLINPLP